MVEADDTTALDPDETAGLKFPHIQTRCDLNQMEQVNIEDGLIWLAKQKNPVVLSDTFVKRLHKELLGEVWEWAGRFRQTEKNIGVAPEQIPMELRKLLHDVQYWIGHESYELKEIALRFHHRLVKIHLFANGNGRHARIMTDALLKSTLREEPIHWGDFDMQNSGKHRQEYINALREADKGNYHLLLKKFL